MIRVILGDQSLPFDNVLSRVILAEESMVQGVAYDSACVFALQGAGSSHGGGSTHAPRGPGDRHGLPPQHQHHGRGDHNNDGGRRGHGRSCDRGNGRDDSYGRGQSSAPRMAPFIGYFASYGMALPSPRPVWIPPNAAGELGRTLGSHAHAYPIQTGPPVPSTPQYPPATY
ncbi:hypothetical protein D1007_07296 [Hordeum vulgare]|nr:hypothetical protein D1007_07296 [Hordeum vulgare]